MDLAELSGNLAISAGITVLCAGLSFPFFYEFTKGREPGCEKNGSRLCRIYSGAVGFLMSSAAVGMDYILLGKYF